MLHGRSSSPLCQALQSLLRMYAVTLLSRATSYEAPQSLHNDDKEAQPRNADCEGFDLVHFRIA